jgi:hypothetical protein
MMMQAYASRTGTIRNLAALRDAGWRLIVSATGAHRSEGLRYAIDNGAWTAHQQGTTFDASAFVQLIDNLGSGADWIVVPDIVGGGLLSLEFSLRWMGRVRACGRPILLAVQDGMDGYDVGRFLGHETGLFVGGSTEWKEETLPHWGRVARDRGCHLHVGRVNSRRRIRLCADAGADSFDGTSASIYSCSLPLLDGERRQTTLFKRPATDA